MRPRKTQAESTTIGDWMSEATSISHKARQRSECRPCRRVFRTCVFSPCLPSEIQWVEPPSERPMFCIFCRQGSFHVDAQNRTLPQGVYYVRGKDTERLIIILVAWTMCVLSIHWLWHQRSETGGARQLLATYVVNR